MSTAEIKIEGYLASDAELRFTQYGQAVLNASIPVTPQRKTESGQWEDAGPTAWYRIAAWGTQAEMWMESGDLVKGALVQVVGTLRPREYDHNGQTRTSLDVTAKSIGVIRPPRDQQQRPTTAQTSQSDPWAAAAASEPPF